jgi:hypothetical protein
MMNSSHSEWLRESRQAKATGECSLRENVYSGDELQAFVSKSCQRQPRHFQCGAIALKAKSLCGQLCLPRSRYVPE